MSRTSGMAVLIIAIVFAVLIARGLQLIRQPTETAPLTVAAPEAVVNPVPYRVRQAPVSGGVLSDGSIAFDVGVSSIPVSEILDTDLRPEDIPPLSLPPTVGPSSADAPGDDDPVVGVVVDEVPRAYPLSVLNYHWVVNDIIEGRGVAVFWDPIAGLAAAYRARVDWKRVEFGASGKFHQGNSLFYDTQTTSLFVPLRASYVAGPLAGERLEPVPSWRQSWSAWLDRFPESRVLAMETGYERPYGTDPYAAVEGPGGEPVDYFATDVMLVEPTRADPERRLPPKEWVLGFLTPDGKAHCCALEELPEDASAPPIEVGEARVGRLADGTPEAMLPDDERPPQAVCFYFAWLGAYPETRVWSSTPPGPVEE